MGSEKMNNMSGGSASTTDERGQEAQEEASVSQRVVVLVSMEYVGTGVVQAVRALLRRRRSVKRECVDKD